MLIDLRTLVSTFYSHRFWLKRCASFARSFVHSKLENVGSSSVTRWPDCSFQYLAMYIKERMRISIQYLAKYFRYKPSKMAKVHWNFIKYYLKDFAHLRRSINHQKWPKPFKMLPVSVEISSNLVTLVGSRKNLDIFLDRNSPPTANILL